jgi:hypothetical protein
VRIGRPIFLQEVEVKVLPNSYGPQFGSTERLRNMEDDLPRLREFLSDYAQIRKTVKVRLKVRFEIRPST